MAPRKKKSSTRRKFKGVNVTQALLGYAGVSIWTEGLMGVSPIGFFTDTTGGKSSFKITGRELLDSAMGGSGGVFKGSADKFGIADNAFAVVAINAKKNAPDMLMKSVGLGVAGSVGLRLTRKPRAQINKFARSLGLGDLIRF